MTTISYKLFGYVRGLVLLVAILAMAIPAKAQLFIQKPGLVTVTNSGTPIAVSFTNELSVATSTNVSLANVTAAAPLPVYMPTNNSGTNVNMPIYTAANPLPVYQPTNVVTTITGDVNLSDTNSIHVTIDGGTNTLEVSAPIPVYFQTNQGVIITNAAANPVPVYMPTNLVSGTVTVSNATLTVAGVVALTNAAASPLPVYMPTNLVSGTLTVSNASIAVTGGVTNVGGYTLVGTAAVDVDTTAAGISAQEALSPAITIANAVRATGGTAILNKLTWIHGGTKADPAVKPAITLLICSDAITWPATNAAVTLVQTELTNLIDVVNIATSDFIQCGTNWVAPKANLGIGISPLATTLYIYPINAAATTNSNPSRLTYTIYQD